MLDMLARRRLLIRRSLGIALGNILITMAYAFITVPNEIINGGVTSFSMVLERMTSIDISVFVNGVTVLLLVACFLFLGKDFLAGSLLSCVLYLSLFTFFHALGFELALPKLLCVAVSGVMVGAGYFLCIRSKSTTVGFDAIALILNKWNARVNVAFAMGVINVLVLLSGLAVYGVSSIVLGLLFTALQAGTLNTLLKMAERRDRQAEDRRVAGR